MKLELIKETSIKGDVMYYIEKDGAYEIGSCATTLKQAEEIYKNITENTTYPLKEVLKSQEVSVNLQENK